jgi:predicted ATPase
MALIGRERELDELDERLRSSRLVTVVGPGGVGKTALAGEGAARAAARFPLGVRRVDLTRVDAAEAVSGAVAAQLGLDSYDALLTSPTDRPALVLIDNCEHLIDAAAATIQAVLDACRAPTILATSRSPLEVPGESVLALAPLEVPAPRDPDQSACPSVRLFLDRARAAGADVSTMELTVVAELCRRLDGLPLAIELAAARARTLGVAEIAARLATGVEVLDRPRFRGERRHRSIVETIRWSYDLLGEPATQLLERLAVFAGPFSTTAARAMAGLDVDTDQFDAQLAELVDASLITVDTTGPETRYRLLDTIRRFALGRLEARGELGPTYDRFADVVLQSLRATLAGATESWGRDLMRDVLAAFDNVAEALRWCNQHDAEPNRALALCGMLWPVVHQRHTDDILSLARQTIDRWPEDGRRRHAGAVATLATAEYVTGSPVRAVELAEAALARLDEPGLPEITLRRVVGQARRALGDTAGALEMFAAGADRARALGMTAMVIELEVAGALVAGDTGRVTEALGAVRTAHGEAERIGSAMSAVWAVTSEGWLTLRVDVDAAVPIIEHGLRRARDLDYPIAVAGNMRSLAFAHLLRGDIAAAAATSLDLLDELVTRGALANLRLLVEAVAALAQAVGHPDRGALGATVGELPFNSLLSGSLLTGWPGVFELPPAGASPVPRLDVLSSVKRILVEIADGVPARRAPAPAPRDDGPAMTSLGDVWELRYRGRVVTVRTTKGIADLARLFAAGGTEIHCLDLADARVADRSTGEVIDAAARRDYEQRIRDLQATIDEAEADNDVGRAERAQVELDTLVDHLLAATGRSGRTRRAADSAERARSAVTQRIRSTIRRIEQLHPELGRHLRASVVTGLYCSYRPEQPTTWAVNGVHPDRA